MAPTSRRTPVLRLALAGLLALLLVAGGVWALTVSEVAPAATPEPAASDAVEQVRVRAADHVGEPAAKVTRELEALGLTVTTTDRRNPGGRVAGTVAAVSPTGLVEPGTRVTLSVWSEAPEPPAPADNGAADDGTVAPGPDSNGPGPRSAQGGKPGPGGSGQGQAATGGGNGGSNGGGDPGKSGTKGNKGGNSGKGGKGGGKPAGGPGKGGKR